MPEPETLLKLVNVTHRYDSGAGEVNVLKGVSLEVRRGESLAA